MWLRGLLYKRLHVTVLQAGSEACLTTAIRRRVRANVKEHKRQHSTPWEWDQAGHTSYKFLLFCFHMGFFPFRPTSVFKTDPSTLWSRRWCLLDSDRWCLLPSWQHERNAAKRAQVSKWSLSCPAGWWDAIVAAVMELQERPCPGCTARKAQMESEMEWGGEAEPESELRDQSTLWHSWNSPSLDRAINGAR